MQRRIGRRLLSWVFVIIACAGPLAGQSLAACTTSWSSAVSGSWSDASKWSAGVPSSTSDACITVNGTYTVTAAGGNAHSLTLGGTSGTQTLLVQGGGGNGSVQLSRNNGGASVSADGVLTLATSDTNYSLLDGGSGTLTNAGTLNLGSGAATGTIYLRSAVTNNGTTNVVSPSATVDTGGRTFTNQGSFTVAAGGAISFGGSGLVNASGAVTNNGSIRISTAYTQGNGTLSGNPPLVSGAIAYTGNGAGTITAVQTGNLSGNLVAGQTLVIQGGGAGGGSYWTPTGPFTNAGTITLKTSDTNYALLDSGGTPNTLTNSGTLNLADGGGSGPLYLRTPVTNTGTVNVTYPAATVDYANRIFTNQGTLAVSAAGAITFPGSGLVNQSGTVSNNGSIRITSSYTQGNGTLSGNPPVVNGAIAYTGSGAGTITAVQSGLLTGSLVSGQILVIQGGSGYGPAGWNPQAAFTNAGTITLRTSDSNYALLDSGGGVNTLTNSGTLNLADGGGSGPLYLRTPVTNTGTVNVTYPNTTVDLGGRAFTNQGTLAISAAGAITFPGSGLVNASGAVTNAGSIRITSSYTQGNGTLSGNPPVVSGSLAYTGNGAGTVSAVGGGTFSGNLSAGQTLVIQGGGGYGNANWSVASPVTSAGTITLQTSDTSYALLDGATLTNNGVVQSAAGGGSGPLYLRVALVNNKTLRLGAGTTITADSGAFTSGKKATLETQIASATSFGALVKTGGAYTIKGTLLTTALGGFKPSPGASFAVLGGAGLSGQFTKLSKAIIDKKTARYYRPVYGAGSVTLVVTNAVVAVSPGSGHAGSAITVTGSGFVDGDKVTITFAAHDGTKTVLGTATASASGTFSFPTNVPAGAVLGSASVTGKDSLAKLTTPGAAYTVN